MMNRITATLAAAAVALASVFAVPAQAKPLSDLEKFLIATTGIVLLGTAINAAKRPTPYYRDTYTQPRNARRVPAHCVHNYRQHNQWVDWNCVQRAGY